MAAYAPITYIKSEASTIFDIPFDYLSQKFIVVLVNDTLNTYGVDYDFLDKTRVRFLKGNIPAGTRVTLKRNTNAASRLVSWRDASVLKAGDLELSQLQLLHIAEEANSVSGSALLPNWEFNWNALGKRLINLGEPLLAQDAVTREYADALSVNGGKYTDSQIKRTLRAAPNEVLGALPVAVSRANKVLGFDASGAPIAVLPTSGSGTEVAVDLANSTDPSKGLGMVAWERAPLSDAIKNAHRMLDAQSVSIWEVQWVMLITNKPDPGDPNTWDWTPAFKAAADYLAVRTDSSSGMETPPASRGVIKLTGHNFGITKYTWRSYVTIEGEESANTFIIPFAGASGFLFDLQNTYDRPRGIGIRHLTIAPNRNVSVDAGAGRSPCSALNIQGFEKQCSIRDVKICNLTGTGIETGDTQDMTIDDVEIRFVGKPLDIHSRAVSAAVGAIVNLTNAVRFTNLRLENSGLSTITGCRAIEFIGGKVERSPLDIVNPHGMDFIGVTWALWTEFAVTVSGINRGIKFHGGSTDTGLLIGGGNTANFISSTVRLDLVGMSFRGHGPEAIRGECSPIGCTFSECDRPYVQGGSTTKFRDNVEANLTSGTGNLAPYNRTPASSYEVATGFLSKTPIRNTWYQNTTMQPIELCLSLPYDSSSQASNFQIKKRHHSASEYTVGEFVHPSGGGVGKDILILSLLPGESYWYNRSGGATDATLMAFYR